MLAEITCPARIEVTTVWPSGIPGTFTQGSCSAGYNGAPTRACNIDGSWGAVSNPCTRTCHMLGLVRVGAPILIFLFGMVEIFCPVLASNGNAAWPRSVAGATAVVGTCSSSYTGTPTRDCGITGSWGAISNGCVRTCLCVCAHTYAWIDGSPWSCGVP